MNAMMLLSELTALPDLTGLSTAGIMGAMWLWERRNSRQREEQLDTAHQRILSDRVRLEQLIALVRQNTQALTTLAERLGPPSRHTPPTGPTCHDPQHPRPDAGKEPP